MREVFHEFKLAELAAALRRGRCAESAYLAVEWTSENPARGQCAVTAMIVQDYLGGELKRQKAVFDGSVEKHYLNVLASGVELDLTRSQYPQGVAMEEVACTCTEFQSLREKLESDDDAVRRYRLLKKKTENLMVKDNAL